MICIYSSKERIFHTIIKEICYEKYIKVSKLSHDWILQLEKDNKVRHIIGNRFDLNFEAAGNIACDKYATYEALKSRNIPVVEHTIIFNPLTMEKYISENGIWNNILYFFRKNNKKIVIKPNNGSEGKGVFLCKNYKEIERAITYLFKTNNSISLCPYYNIDLEYRIFYLDVECYLAYSKNKQYVIGDGVKSLYQLLDSSYIINIEENIFELETQFMWRCNT